MVGWRDEQLGSAQTLVVVVCVWFGGGGYLANAGVGMAHLDHHGERWCCHLGKKTK